MEIDILDFVEQCPSELSNFCQIVRNRYTYSERFALRKE